MKTLFTLIISTLTFVAFSQKERQLEITSWKAAPEQHFSHEVNMDAGNLAAEEIILAESNYPQNIKLVEVYQRKSKAFTHTTFHIYKDGKRVYGVEAKLSQANRSKKAMVQYPAINFTASQSTFPEQSLAPQAVSEMAQPSVHHSEQVWIISPEGFLTPGLAVEAEDKALEGSHREILYSGGEVVKDIDLNRYFHEHTEGPNDTTVNMYVFDPDPLSTAGKTYGGAYQDNNDSDSPELNNQRKLRSTTFSYINNQFVAANDYVKIADFSQPSVSPVTGSQPLFDFTRSQDHFEDVNVMFHISNHREHLNSIGYPQLPSYQIEVDAHALSGADQSFFNTSSFPHRLYFGEGGVDDAEDADVILHEFSHAVIFEASPSGNISTERACIEEALCDYYAVSYSKTRHSTNSDKVFNWDGHNDFWSGRTGKTSLTYDNIQFTGNIYSYTSVLVSPLLTIYDQLGRNGTDELVTEAIYFLHGQSTMNDFAMYMFKADSALNGGANYYVIANAFADQKIINSNMIGQQEIAGAEGLEIRNTDQFARGGALRLFAGNHLIDNITLYDIQGRVVLRKSTKAAEVSLSSSQLASGHYILSASCQGKNYQFKLSVL